MPNTIQTGIKEHSNDNLTNYALFMGGTNVINEVLMCYDPLITGYGRLFMVRKPVFLEKFFEGTGKLEKFKHIVEYGNTSVQGIADVTVNTESITGGYNGKSFEIPTMATDDSTQLSVNVYEFSGSPVREVIHSWINGTRDLLSGLSHYNGVEGIEKLQANQTAEFIYVATDVTGMRPEYCCLWANCFPKGINNDPFNYNAGEHALVQTTIEFTGTKYESRQINEIGAALLAKYKINANSLNFYSGYSADSRDLGGHNYPVMYDSQTGKMREYNINAQGEFTSWR